MRLLILTQKVDRNDPILGFFHRWVEEFSKHFEKVIVICLEEGEHNLPGNVRVLSLGKEKNKSRINYVINFFHYIWRERKNYDAVFVHMNQIYVILGFPIWKLLGKTIGLWYAHKHIDWSLRLAEKLADIIFSASKESFRLKSSKLQVMGHGIDVNFFSPDNKVVRDGSWLSVGRLMPSKRHDQAIQEAFRADKELRIVGGGPEQENLSNLAQQIGAQVKFLGPLTQEELRDEYQRSTLLIHRSETGSLDKVVLEAAACGMVVDSTDPAISKLHLNRECVVKNHSLPELIKNIKKTLQ